jgi:hypothetical protein
VINRSVDLEVNAIFGRTLGFARLQGVRISKSNLAEQLDEVQVKLGRGMEEAKGCVLAVCPRSTTSFDRQERLLYLSSCQESQDERAPHVQCWQDLARFTS